LAFLTHGAGFGGTTEVVPFPFVLHAGAVAAQANSGFLDSAVPFGFAQGPAALGMTKLRTTNGTNKFVPFPIPFRLASCILRLGQFGFLNQRWGLCLLWSGCNHYDAYQN
jgi:hypothetical protein